MRTLLLLLVCVNVHAAIITSSSTSQADVQAAVNVASDGDTVVIPATAASGVNWTQSLLISKSITLMGAGTVSPNITKLNNTIAWDGVTDTYVVHVSFPASEGDKPVRVTGIYFDNLTTPIYTHNSGYAGPDKSGMLIFSHYRELDSGTDGKVNP